MPNAFAKICGGNKFSNVSGFVKFYKSHGGVIIEAEICGLPRSESGFFAFHIHESGDCRGDGFTNTGGHLNPGKTDHPRHAGDLPPLLSDHGKAYMKVFTDRFCIGEIINRSIVIHSAPDDFMTQPSGNAGEKIACGLICDIEHLR